MPGAGTAPAVEQAPPKEEAMSPGPRESTARDVMTGGTECVGEGETMVEAAKKLAQLNVDALPYAAKTGRCGA